MTAFACALVYAIARALAFSYRFRHHGQHPARLSSGGGLGHVLAIWHQNLFAGILAQLGQPHTVMVSRSRDGDPVANLCSRLGNVVVRGSSAKRGVDKGGKEAKEEMIEVLCTGIPGAITVDGPSGPARQVKPGIIDIARRAGVPILPYLAVAEHAWEFRSWDRFRLPMPFSRVHVYYGAAVTVTADTTDASFIQMQEQLRLALDALQQAHDLMMAAAHPGRLRRRAA